MHISDVLTYACMALAGAARVAFLIHVAWRAAGSISLDGPARAVYGRRDPKTGAHSGVCRSETDTDGAGA